MPRTGKREYVTFKSVRLALYPHGERWRVAFPDDSVKGGWRYITRSTKALAKEAGHAKAVEIASGMLDLSNLTEEQARLARAFLDLKPSWEVIERLRRETQLSRISITEAIDQFHTFKIAEKGQETKHIKLTKSDLKSLAENVGPDTPLSSIDKGHILDWLDGFDIGWKRRKDYRAAAVGLWKWASKQDLLIQAGRFSEPEKIPTPKGETGQIRFFTIAEMRFLLKSVQDDYLPWLVLASFTGLRTGEIRSWHKPPLDWSMINYDSKVVIVPANLSKNRKRKILPLSDAAMQWLDHIGRPSKGMICPKPANNSETGRLGKMLDDEFKKSEGWPDNGPRHSYASYRAAITGDLAKLASEMDNSIQILKTNYVEAALPADGEQYFNLIPSEVYRT